MLCLDQIRFEKQYSPTYFGLLLVSGLLLYPVDTIGQWVLYLLSILYVYSYGEDVFKRKNILLLGMCSTVCVLLYGGISPWWIIFAWCLYTLVQIDNKNIVLVLALFLYASTVGQTIVSILSQSDWVFMPVVAPVLVLTVILCIVYERWLSLFILPVVELFVVWLSTLFGISSMASMIVMAVVGVISTVYLYNPRKSLLLSVWAVVVILLIVSQSFFQLPNSTKQIAVVLPNADEAYESKYFINYVESLRFIGLDAVKWSVGEEVIPETLFLIPWVSEQIFTKEEWEIFVESAADSDVSIVVLGEHTNYGLFADRWNSRLRGLHWSDDLTVPLNNSDTAGVLRTSAIGSLSSSMWLNRGASVNILSAMAVPLWFGDGWFTEPNLGDPLWVGDYKLGNSDRRGRILLSARTKQDGISWTYIGDNSFALNRQLLVDPKPFLQALAWASGWQIILGNIGGIILIGLMVSSTETKYASYFVSLISVVIAYSLLFPKTPEYVRDMNLGESSVHNTSFSEAWTQLVKEPWFSKIRIIRHAGNIDANRIGKTDYPEIHFGWPEEGGNIAGISISNCWHVGQIPMEDGVVLQDARTCKVNGKRVVALGSSGDEVAVKVDSYENPILLVFDKGFLSNQATVTKNVDWIRKEAPLLLQ